MQKRNKTWIGKIQRILICAGLALFLAAAVIPSTPCDARRLVKPEMVMPKHYPDGFHGFGHIDAINRDHVVINDIGYRLSPSATYNTPAAANVPVTYFRQGVIAGFLMNPQNEIVSLWLIE